MLVLRARVTRFVILFNTRSGSSYLVSALDSHPAIAAEGEQLALLRPEGSQAQLAWAERFLKGPAVGRNRAIGFKTKAYDILDHDGLAGILRRLDVRIIAMHRRNEIKNAVSRLKAQELFQQSGKWNRDQGIEATGPSVVDPDELDKILEHVAIEDGLVTDYVEQVGLPSLRIAYEDLLTQPDAIFRETLSFLGVPHATLTANTLKNTSDDLREAIANFAEVRSHYAGTRYEPMFDEVLVT